MPNNQALHPPSAPVAPLFPVTAPRKVAILVNEQQTRRPWPQQRQVREVRNNSSSVSYELFNKSKLPQQNNNSSSTNTALAGLAMSWMQCGDINDVSSSAAATVYNRNKSYKPVRVSSRIKKSKQATSIPNCSESKASSVAESTASTAIVTNKALDMAMQRIHKIEQNEENKAGSKTISNNRRFSFKESRRAIPSASLLSTSSAEDDTVSSAPLNSPTPVSRSESLSTQSLSSTEKPVKVLASLSSNKVKQSWQRRKDDPTTLLMPELSATRTASTTNQMSASRTIYPASASVKTDTSSSTPKNATKTYTMKPVVWKKKAKSSNNSITASGDVGENITSGISSVNKIYSQANETSVQHHDQQISTDMAPTVVENANTSQAVFRSPFSPRSPTSMRAGEEASVDLVFCTQSSTFSSHAVSPRAASDHTNTSSSVAHNVLSGIKEEITRSHNSQDGVLFAAPSDESKGCVDKASSSDGSNDLDKILGEQKRATPAAKSVIGSSFGLQKPFEFKRSAYSDPQRRPWSKLTDHSPVMAVRTSTPTKLNTVNTDQDKISNNLATIVPAVTPSPPRLKRYGLIKGQNATKTWTANVSPCFEDVNGVITTTGSVRDSSLENRQRSFAEYRHRKQVVLSPTVPNEEAKPTSKIASSFLAAVAKASKVGNEVIAGENNTSSDSVKGNTSGLELHLSSIANEDSLHYIDDRSIDLKSVRSALENPSPQKQPSDDAGDDDNASVKSLREKFERHKKPEEPVDDDTNSIKSLRDRYEPKPEPKETAVAKKRAMFEKKSVSPQKRVSYNNAVSQARSKYELKGSPRDSRLHKQKRSNEAKHQLETSKERMNDTPIDPKSFKYSVQQELERAQALDPQRDKEDLVAYRNRVKHFASKTRKFTHFRTSAKDSPRRGAHTSSTPSPVHRRSNVDFNTELVQIAAQRIPVAVQNDNVEVTADDMSYNVPRKKVEDKETYSTDLYMHRKVISELAAAEAKEKLHPEKSSVVFSFQDKAPETNTYHDGNSTISGSELTDGVTLDMSIADVSNLTTPTALASKCDMTGEVFNDDATDAALSGASDEIADLIEVEARRSAASSSQTSEAARPLLARLLRFIPMSDEMSVNDSYNVARVHLANMSNENTQQIKPSPYQSNIISSSSSNSILDTSSVNSMNGWDTRLIATTFPSSNTPSPNNIFDFDSEWQSFANDATCGLVWNEEALKSSVHDSPNRSEVRFNSEVNYINSYGADAPVNIDDVARSKTPTRSNVLSTSRLSRDNAVKLINDRQCHSVLVSGDKVDNTGTLPHATYHENFNHATKNEHSITESISDTTQYNSSSRTRYFPSMNVAGSNVYNDYKNQRQSKPAERNATGSMSIFMPLNGCTSQEKDVPVSPPSFETSQYVSRHSTTLPDHLNSMSAYYKEHMDNERDTNNCSPSFDSKDYLQSIGMDENGLFSDNYNNSTPRQPMHQLMPSDDKADVKRALSVVDEESSQIYQSSSNETGTVSINKFHQASYSEGDDDMEYLRLPLEQSLGLERARSDGPTLASRRTKPEGPVLSASSSSRGKHGLGENVNMSPSRIGRLSAASFTKSRSSNLDHNRGSHDEPRKATLTISKSVDHSDRRTAADHETTVPTGQSKSAPTTPSRLSVFGRTHPDNNNKKPEWMRRAEIQTTHTTAAQPTSYRSSMITTYDNYNAQQQPPLAKETAQSHVNKSTPPQQSVLPAALVARLKSLKEARLQRARAIYAGRSYAQRVLAMYTASHPEIDEHSQSTMSSTTFGGRKFLASLEVD